MRVLLVVFWSDFYLDHEESSLISIDPFTGSEEHLKNPEKLRWIIAIRAHSSRKYRKIQELRQS